MKFDVVYHIFMSRSPIAESSASGREGKYGASMPANRSSFFLRRRVFAIPAFAFLCCLSVLFFAGCGDGEKTEPGGLSLRGQSVLTGLLSKKLDDDIRIMVYGKDADGPAPQLPVPGTRVTFRIIEQPEGAGHAAFSSVEAVSDAAGLAVVSFTLGDKPGIYRMEAAIPGRSDIAPVQITVLGGVKIEGGGQDGWVGHVLEKRLAVHLESAPGVPLGEDDGQVRFVLMGAPEGTSLSSNLVHSSNKGEAATEIRLGDKQGRVDVGISILEGLPGQTSQLEPILVTFFGIDVYAVAVSMLGGLALFLYGMKMMSESLQFVAGDKLRDLLNLLTKNRFMAVAAGAMVTALIQSSSACSVMVVGFVNAGLMQLEQAIAVIMGANIGTTITAQIISLKLSKLALPAIVVGVMILFMAKRQTVKYWASIVIGFGVLFLGMNIMSQELGQLRDSTSVISLFRGLDCVPGPDGFVPFWQFMKAIGCGLVVTLILQSSAATIGMLITVASAGLIDPYAAFGILLGDNIGTTITAVLASIGTGTAAKRAACFHVSFNVLGVVLMTALNYVQWPGRTGRPVFMELANLFTPGDVFQGGENLPRFLANAHTLFNVSCTALFVFFIPQFAKLCRFIVRDEPNAEREDDARRLLEPHLLATPSLALQQVWTEVGIMLEKARVAQNEGYRALISAPTSEWNTSAREARNLEKETDELKKAITKYLSGISLTTLNENQSEMFPHLVRTVNDAEKVADLGKHLSKLAKRVNKRSLRLTDEAVEDMNQMVALVDEILELAEKTVNINADGIEMSGGGAVLRRKLLEDGRRLAKTAKSKASTLRKNHERRHEEGLCDIKSGVVFLDVANSLARSAGCAFNIIEAACHTVSTPAMSMMSRRLTAIMKKP